MKWRVIILPVFLKNREGKGRIISRNNINNINLPYQAKKFDRAKNMTKIIKEILMNKKARNSAALIALVAAVMNAGQPWYLD